MPVLNKQAGKGPPANVVVDRDSSRGREIVVSVAKGSLHLL